MIDPKTYGKAMRAAASVVRGSRKTAGALTTVALLTAGPACLTDTKPGAMSQDVDGGIVADLGGADMATVDGIVQDLLDALFDQGTPDGLPDGVTVDAAPGELPVADVAPDGSASDVAVTDGSPSDVAVSDGASQDVTVSDIPPWDEGTAVDTAVSDPGTLPDLVDDDWVATDMAGGDGSNVHFCLVSNGEPCDGWWDSKTVCSDEVPCQEFQWEFSDIACIDGTCQTATCEGASACIADVCHEGDLQNEEAMECCQLAYQDPNAQWPIPGCNPWGPPAPPRWDGRRLGARLVA